MIFMRTGGMPVPAAPPGEILAHGKNSTNPCRNECMTELMERVQWITQAGVSKPDGGP